MRRLSVIIILLFLAGFAQAQTQTPITGKVTVHETDNKGKYFSYIIANEGDEVLEGGTYRIYLRVNKKDISFDRKTSDLEPGKAIKYESNRVFRKNAKVSQLNYSLELTQKKSKKRKKLQEGVVIL